MPFITRIFGGGSWGTYSDIRLKDVEGPYLGGLDKLEKLNPIYYRYKDGNGEGIGDRDLHIGFSAQDVQSVIPEAVEEDENGYLIVDNDPILWTMFNAIKELKAENDALRGRVEALEGR